MRILISFIISTVALGATLLAASYPAQTPAGGSHMQEHFSRVEAVQNAVVRGDMEGAREPARWIAEHEGGPGLAETQVKAMRLAAQRAADAKDIHLAANAVATMASTCGTCHRMSGVTPKLPAPAALPEGSGLSGHMLAHQQAVEYLYQGLVAPSDNLWKKGAELLKSAPMASDAFPSDPALTDEIKASETRIHQYADMARKATDPKGRVNLYGEVIATCASCHGLHGRAWGPGLPKP